MSRERKATYGNLQELACELRLSEAAYSRAMEIAGLSPDRPTWRRYVDLFLTLVGTALILAGIAAFFAWNWADLSRFHKFALIQTGILAAAVAAWRFGLDSLVGKASLFAMAFLVGTLLAVYGQVYQTGADPYGLFLTWALLILPLCLIGRQWGLWLLFAVLLNLTVIMYYTQVLHPPDGWWQLSQVLGPLVWLGTTVADSTLASYLFALNVLVLVVWEVDASRGVGWMQGRAFPNLIALAAFATVLPPSLIMIVAGGAFTQHVSLSFVSPVLLAITTLVCLWYYRVKRRDLFILTLCLLSLILVVTSLVLRHLVEGTGSLLFVAILLIAQVSAAAWWLRTIARGWERPA